MFSYHKFMLFLATVFFFSNVLLSQEVTEFKIFNLTIDTFQPTALKMNRGRIIWKDKEFGGTLYNLKFFDGQSIAKLDSGLTDVSADIDGDYVVWNTASQEIKIYDIRDWTTAMLANSHNPTGNQPVSIHNGLLAYARPGSSGGSEIVLHDLRSAQDTIFSAALWNRQPDVHHGQLAWVASSSENPDDPSDIVFYDGRQTQNLTNNTNSVNKSPIVKDAQVTWFQEDGNTRRILLFTAQGTSPLAQTTNANVNIQGYDLSDGAAVAAFTDTTTYTSQIFIYDAESGNSTTLIIQDSVATPGIDNRLVMWVEGQRRQDPRIKTYHLDTQSFSVFGTAYAAVLDDEEYAWTFGESVALGRPVTYEQMTNDAQNGWAQSRFKPIDDGNLVWGNYENSANMRIFYNDGNNTTQLTDSAIFRDFVMANDGYVIWRHDTDFLWLYDGVNPPVQVVDSIQLENPYTAGGFIGFFGFYLSDPNAVRYPFLYDIQSGSLTQLRQNDVDPWTVMCDGDNAVWQEGFLGDIVYYDGSNIVALSDSATDSDYSYRNGIIVWSELRDNIFQIMMHDVASGNTTQLTNSPAHQVIPATDGQVITWFENPNFPLAPADSLMWYYDIASGQRTKAANFYRRGFKQNWLDNGKVGWWRGGKVFVYDGQVITRLTNEFQTTAEVFVDGEFMVWRETPNPNFQDNGDIFRGKLQPRVAFDARNIVGDAPLTVSFDNRSWQGDQSYQWDFGDQNTSSEENPTHTYQQPGNYTVTLTVTGPTGSVSERKVNLVQVEPSTGISGSNSNTPQRFALHQNYPNPFNPSTTIRFDVARQGKVALRIYNILGQEVATLVDKRLVPGQYDVQWNANGMASGVYFYHLIVDAAGKADQFVQSRKLILMK